MQQSKRLLSIVFTSALFSALRISPNKANYSCIFFQNQLQSYKCRFNKQLYLGYFKLRQFRTFCVAKLKEYSPNTSRYMSNQPSNLRSIHGTCLLFAFPELFWLLQSSNTSTACSLLTMPYRLQWAILSWGWIRYEVESGPLQSP